MAKGPEKLANNVNKGIFLIFDHFISYFYREIEKIKDLRMKMPKAERHITDAQADKLESIVRGIIQDFGARERRTYMASAFRNRSAIKVNVNFHGTKDFALFLFHLSKRVFSPRKAIAEIKAVYMSTMNDLIEVCDQSLLGLVSLIDVYRARMLNKPIPDFNPNDLQPLSDDHDYLYGERVRYSALIDEMKLALIRKYFDHEIQARVVKDTGNYFKTIKDSFNELNFVKEKTGIKGITDKFTTYTGNYKEAHRFETKESKRRAQEKARRATGESTASPAPADRSAP